MKRSRRGGRRPQHTGGGGSSHSNNGGNIHNPNRVFDSNGPEVKVRGSATSIYEKYLQLARDANSSGDRVMAENYLQHAEHYFRIVAAQQQAMAQFQQQQASQQLARQGDQPYPQQGQAPQSSPSFSLADAEEEVEEETAE